MSALPSIESLQGHVIYGNQQTSLNVLSVVGLGAVELSGYVFDSVETVVSAVNYATEKAG